jgi:inhibitor of KinA
VTDYRIVPAGDAAVTVEFDAKIAPAVNARAIAVARSIDDAQVSGVRDIVPAFRAVTVFFDPLRVDRQALFAQLELEAARSASSPAISVPLHRVPVCYDAEFGPDLEDVAAFAHLSRRDVVSLHAARTYRVYMLGFLPGFAYLGLVDERIAAPRRLSPRTHVAAGSVGIAGRQTGIYPMASPGGWQLIGRTPLCPFDPALDNPFLLRAGDAVEFYEIDRDSFDRLSEGG